MRAVMMEMETVMRMAMAMAKIMRLQLRGLRQLESVPDAYETEKHAVRTIEARIDPVCLGYSLKYLHYDRARMLI